MDRSRANDDREKQKSMTLRQEEHLELEVQPLVGSRRRHPERSRCHTVEVGENRVGERPEILPPHRRSRRGDVRSKVIARLEAASKPKP
jgi:hypothetical protein